eukprot:8460245-Pyramimonas_sp.AAC.2
MHSMPVVPKTSGDTGKHSHGRQRIAQGVSARSSDNAICRVLGYIRVTGTVGLPAHGVVADGDGEALLEKEGSVHDNVGADVHHGAVGCFRHGRRTVGAIGLHLRVLHEHVPARDAHVVEPQESVVHRVVSHLVADVADDDPGQRGVVLGAPNMYQESVGAVVSSLCEEARHHHRVRGGLPQTTRPPLCGSDGRAVDDPLLSLAVVCRGRL